jgi:phage N-6-adenine-methyltransferase
MNTALMFSSKSDEWETPRAVFDPLAREFPMTVDVAATAENAKCRQFITAHQNALHRAWWEYGDYGWCNPPYSRGLQSQFIAKAAEERTRGFTTVMLLPARTDTKAFHTYIYDATRWEPRIGVEIRFLPGRVKFGEATASAPFPSMVVVFKP